MTWRVLESALTIARASDGVFDFTVAPLLAAAGFLPASTRRQPLFRAGGFRDVLLLPDGSVRFRRPLMIDLGGIAKGFAVDAACAALDAHGVKRYVVNAGGDLRVGAQAETIHVRLPGAPGALLPVARIRAAAVATSAGYYAVRRVRGRAVQPIISTRRCALMPAAGSVTVVASTCTLADALTKVVCAEPARAGRILERFGAEALLIRGRRQWRMVKAVGKCAERALLT
jgi:thiamine biosynthesis lipoprotein